MLLCMAWRWWLHIGGAFLGDNLIICNMSLNICILFLLVFLFLWVYLYPLNPWQALGLALTNKQKKKKKSDALGHSSLSLKRLICSFHFLPLGASHHTAKKLGFHYGLRKKKKRHMENLGGGVTVFDDVAQELSAATWMTLAVSHGPEFPQPSPINRIVKNWSC